MKFIGDYVMDSTLVTVMAGVLGSLVGGTATAATAWVTAEHTAAGN